MANGRFAKENEINKESGRCKDRVSIIPRAKVKELPFAFAEDLKGGRAEPERDRERRLWGEGEGTRQGDGEEKEKGKRGSSVSIAICRIADLRNNNDPSVGGGRGVGSGAMTGKRETDADPTRRLHRGSDEERYPLRASGSRNASFQH